MSSFVQIVALVEGPSERIFLSDLIAPHLAARGIFLTPIVISKPGQKGGDVRFARVRNDIGLHLKQRNDTYLTLFLDYYGLRSDWPGLDEAKKQTTPGRKAESISRATFADVERVFGEYGVYRRFFPYFSIHEFEALLFSDPATLATQLGVSRSAVDEILTECGEPEAIDDSPQTAPSKRLAALSARYKKTSTSIAIARATGLEAMRRECPIFNMWLTKVENLSPGTAQWSST